MRPTIELENLTERGDPPRQGDELRVVIRNAPSDRVLAIGVAFFGEYASLRDDEDSYYEVLNVVDGRADFRFAAPPEPEWVDGTLHIWLLADGDARPLAMYACGALGHR